MGAITEIKQKDGICTYAVEIFAILCDCITPLSFTKSEVYEDQFGGIVIDFYERDNRITCIVSEQCVQILSCLNDKIQEQIFQRSSARVKLEIFEYLKGPILRYGEVEDLNTT